MAEIKVFCLHCGQHIQCDEGYRGVQINCPSCNQSFSVPAAQPITPPPSSLPTKPAWLIAGIIVSALIGIIFLGLGLYALLPSQGTSIIGFILFISLSILYFSNGWNLHLASQGKSWRLVGHILLIWPLAILVERSFPTPNKKPTNWYVVAGILLFIVGFFALMIKLSGL